MLLYLSHKHTEIVNTHILMLIYSVEIIDITQHVEYYDTQTKGRGQCSCNLGCVCFGWKSLPEMLFRKWGCLVGPENSIFWKLKSVDPKKKPLTTEIDLHFYFPFKAFPENERERESARARERRSDDRDLVVARSRRWLRSRDGKIAPLIAISPPRDRAGERSERLWLVFLDLCFPSSFPNTRKYFPENFLKCNQTHGNIFLFRKLAFPENMYFPENVLQQPNTA